MQTFDSNLERVSTLSKIAIIWLIIPFLMFVVTYFEWYLIIAIGALVYYFFALPSLESMKNVFTRPWLYHCASIAFLTALLFIWLSGVFPPFFFTGDWYKSYSIMNLLVASDDWPPILYKNNEAGFLRYNIGLFILPSLLEKVISIGVDRWLGVYEVVGLALFYVLLIEAVYNPAQPRHYNIVKSFLILLLFMGFSGADVVGSFFTKNPPMGPVAFNHIEWWDKGYSFPAISTQLLWTPQHCIPAWIGVALLYLNARYNGRSLGKSIFLVGALLAFWSPLVFIGFVLIFPFYYRSLFATLHNPKELLMIVLVALVLMLPMSVFYSTSVGTIPQWWRLSGDSAVIKGQLRFLILEYFLYLALIRYLEKDDSFVKQSIPAIVVLSLIVISYNFGGTGELPLKVTMPATALLSIFVVRIFINDLPYKPTFVRDCFKVALVFVYFAGITTPIFELARFGFYGRDDPYKFKFTENKELMDDAHFGQYFALVKEKPFFVRLETPIQGNTHEQ